MQLMADSFSLLKTLILKLETAPDVESALNTVVQTICQQCQWTYGEVWQLDYETNLLTNRTTVCNIDCIHQASRFTALSTCYRQLSEIRTFALQEGIPGRVWASQQREWHPDVSATSEQVFLRTKEAADCGLKAVLGMPLVVDEQTLAVLLFFSDEVLPEDPQLVEIIDAISIPIGRLIQQRQVEKQLRDSEARFRAFMDNSEAVIFMKDSQGYFTYVNRPLEQEFKLQPGELIGKTDFYHLSEEIAQQVRENDARVLSTNQSQSLVEVVPTLEGVKRYWQVNKFPFTDQLGQRYVGGVAFDITQLKQMEQQLPLDRLKQQRITESLQLEARAAEAANDAKSSFLAMMSHEIRTPMNAMLGMTELLGGTILDPQQQDFVDIIQRGGNTLLTVINDILDFSKVESNNLELEVGFLDIYDCVEQVLTLFSNQTEEKGLSLTSIIEMTEPDLIYPYFQGDATRLRQILSNLISNSIKFTRKGEVSVQVKISSVDGDPSVDGDAQIDYALHFLIKDTGIGIAQEKIPKLFQPFSQVDTSITRRYGGTGLGLAISKQLIELMGGEIDVVSEVGEGSTFRFSIKLPAYSKAWEGDLFNAKTNLDGKHLLIIDSNEISRRSLILQAQSWKLTVESAETAGTALIKLLNNDRFDAIAISEPVSDLASSRLVAQIRNLPHYSTVPVILLQARTSHSTQTSSLLSTQTKRLQKPVRRSQFYNLLVQLLQPEAAIFPSDFNDAVERNADGNLNQGVSAESAADNRLSDRKPLHILLVEDIRLNQKVALQMLSTYGYRADVANNGKEAISAIQNQLYDLVFMDVQMPEIDGLKATQIIRADPSIEQPYIVAMTAHAMQGDRENCLSAGMDDYMRKPIRRRDLLAILQQCPLHRNVEKPFKQVCENPPLQAESLSSLPTLDTTIIESLNTDSSFLKEVCDGFLDDAPERISAIQTALEKADALAVAHTAHALKSLSSCVGAMALFNLCKSIEAIGKSNCTKPALPLMAKVMSEYEKVRLALQTYKGAL